MECPVLKAVNDWSKRLYDELSALKKNEDKEDYEWNRQRTLVAVLAEVDNWLKTELWKGTHKT